MNALEILKNNKITTLAKNTLFFEVRVISNEPFPLLLGCSLEVAKPTKVHIGEPTEIIDITPKIVEKNGVVCWEIDTDKRSGKVVFSLWQDNSYTERLATTGWIKW